MRVIDLTGLFSSMYMRLSQCILILSWSLRFTLYRRTLCLSSNQRLIFYYNFAIIRSSFVCIWLQHVLLCQTMCCVWEADSAPLWLQFLVLDRLVHFQCVYFSWGGIQPLTIFYRKLIVCGVFLEQIC